jgi:hypothetical protein
MYKCRLTYDEWKSMRNKKREWRFVHSDDFEPGIKGKIHHI